MQNTRNRLLLAKDDYAVIMAYIKKGLRTITYSRQDAEELELELKKARVVSREELPLDVVRLNSKVTIKEEKDDKILELTLVIPEKANIKQRFVSIMSPIGTALIGFRKGQQVKWKVPGGIKTFTILDVINEPN